MTGTGRDEEDTLMSVGVRPSGVGCSTVTYQRMENLRSSKNQFESRPSACVGTLA